MPATLNRRMLNVGIDAGPLHGHRTGVGNAVAWTIEALTDPAADLADINLLPYVTSMRARVDKYERRLPIPAALAMRLWAHRSPRFDRLLGSPDIVHGTNYVVPPTACPRLISVYDCWFLEHRDEALPDVRRAGDVLRHAVADGAHVVTSSESTAARVRQLLSTDRVRSIHLGPPPHIDAESTRPPSLPDFGDDPFILALGTLERRKNLPTLVAAFGRLAREHPNSRLIIAGAIGDDLKPISQAIAMLDASTAQRVTRLGQVDTATKSWLLRNARALAYPSLDEGFGFPILEAQQVGTPVVASTAGSIPEVAGTGALLSAPHDSEALAANLHWVLTSDEMHAKLVQRGHTNLGRFSWANTADELAATYRKLVNA